MATATDTQHRVMLALESAELMLHDLPDVASEWETLSGGERAAWAMDWSNEMSALEWVRAQSEDGIAPAQLHQLRRIEARLMHHAPDLIALKLYIPAFIVEVQ